MRKCSQTLKGNYDPYSDTGKGQQPYKPLSVHRYHNEDEKQRDRVAARNQLESYTFSVKQAAEDAGSKLTDADKNAIIDKAKSVLTWLETNTLAEKEEFEDKLKEIQKECSPIMTKLHQAGGKGPTVEEVD